MALLHVNGYSDILGMDIEMDVILPQDARGQIGVSSAASERCQTLLLLHGMSDDQTIWQRLTSIERYASDRNLAVVMPTTHLGWYTDMHMGYRYFSFVSGELVDICRGLFPQMSHRREHTFVAGLSMGGYGAIKCGLLRSDVFSHAASLSGALDVAEIARQQAAGSESLWQDVFGPPDGIADSDDDLFAAASRLAGDERPRLFQWCGTGDFLYLQNVRMRDHLNRLGYDLRYSEGPGDHQWKYWDEQIQSVLDWLPLQGGER